MKLLPEVDGMLVCHVGLHGQLRIYLEPYKNMQFLHIRYWYLDKTDGQYKPSVKGIAIPEKAINPCLQAIKQVLTNGARKGGSGAGAEDAGGDAAVAGVDGETA